MKNTGVIAIRDNDLEEEASLWIVKMERGLSVEDEDALRAWLSLSVKHQRYFLHYAEAWGKTEALASLADLFPRVKPEPSRYARRWWWRTVLGSVAASIMFLLILPLDKTPLNLPVVSYETAVGGLSNVVLSDGSVLTLNTNTQVEVVMGPKLRRLILSTGEINLDVAKDPSRPLQVVVGETVFEAVGTQFNIKIDQTKHVELLVTEGLVRVGVAPKDVMSFKPIVGKKSHDLLLGQGEKVTVKGGARVLETLPDSDIKVELSWKEGNLIFKGEPLGEAITEISRYTSVEFIVVDDDLKTIQIAGLFKSGDVAGFLSSLEANFGVRHERHGNKTYLTAPPK